LEARGASWARERSGRAAARTRERAGRAAAGADGDRCRRDAHDGGLRQGAGGGDFKGGYGHHPLLCYLDDTGEALAGILRAGNAGSNTAADHKQVLDLALAQLDQQALEGEILVRGDGAGATHELCVYCREGNMRFSFGSI
jgi:hypothetical protein